MKKILSIVFALVVATSLFAQNSGLRQRLELAEVSDETDGYTLEVFRMQDNGNYYLSVGNLGFGDDIIQFQIDPIFELFIPLGGTLDEALETMKTIQSWYKLPRQSSNEVQGCLSAAYPNDDYETVTVTRRQIITSNVLEFSVARGNLVRATHIGRMNFNSLVGSLKIYKKLHPKE